MNSEKLLDATETVDHVGCASGILLPALTIIDNFIESLVKQLDEFPYG